jgi:CO/xanthine dehydrogenase Mo-binding subunit
VNEIHRIVGQPVPRKDARGKVLGEANYHAHARIRSIHTSRASSCPGVIAVLTAKDIPGTNSIGPIVKDQPVLCGDVVRYVGDAVALAAAESERAAEQALEQIIVDYEPLAAVLDPLKALEPGAPQVQAKCNIGSHSKTRRGDTEQALREAAVVVERRYFTQRAEHAYMETETALVAPDPTGGFTVWASTQYPHRDREEVSRILGIGQSRVRVHQMTTGGGFGGKLTPHAQCYAALIAWKTGRPATLPPRRVPHRQLQTPSLRH